jgi:hypothetical protein
MVTAPDRLTLSSSATRAGGGGWWLAIAIVLPLIVPLVWSGFRLAFLPDSVLAALSSTEAPWSIRDPLGVWALLLVLTWFGLAYRARSARWWELPLVLLAATVMLPRMGNGWLTALLLVLPLRRQVGLPSHGRTLIAAAVGCAIVAAALTIASRPAPLPQAAPSSAAGAVFADHQWASELQRRLPARVVLGGRGLAGESTDYWLDYLRVVQGHERWATILRDHGVRAVILAPDARAAIALLRVTPEWRVLQDDDSGFVAERT